MKQTLKYIYERLFENLRYAETKHSITMTIASAVIAFASTFFSDNNIVNIITSACIMLALLSILYSFIALLSRKVKVSHKEKNDTHQNLMLYSTIKNFSDISYCKKIKTAYNLPPSYKIDEMDLDLARQVITTAKLVNLKFSYFNFSLVFLFLSLLCGIVVVCIKGNLV